MFKRLCALFFVWFWMAVSFAIYDNHRIWGMNCMWLVIVTCIIVSRKTEFFE